MRVCVNAIYVRLCVYTLRAIARVQLRVMNQWFPTFLGLGPLLGYWRASGATKNFLNLANAIYMNEQRLPDLFSLE